MAYREDSDLAFLENIKSENLNDLVTCLTRGKDGIPLLTQELLSSELYKKHQPDHHAYWQLIAAEIQCFGANSFATMARGGKGVLYREVLTDVCDKLKVNYNKDSNVGLIEQNLLMKILTDAIENMGPEEIKELAESFGVKNTNGLTKDMAIASMQAIFRAGGFKSYQIAVALANAVMKAIFGKTLTWVGNQVLTRALKVLTGPVGLAVTGIMTVIDIGGAAYRVTVPAVFHIALLRQLDNNSSEISQALLIE